MVWKTFCTYARERLRDWKVNLRLKVLGMTSSLLTALAELAGEQPEHRGRAAPLIRSSKSCRRQELMGKHCLAKRVGKTDGELWLVCSSARRLLMTSSSVSHECKRSGFRMVTGHFGLACFLPIFSFCLHTVGFGKARECAAEGERFVHLHALVQ